MTEPLEIGIVIGSTRPHRFADRPAKWFLELAEKRAGVSFELVDLRDYPLPFFEEAGRAANGAPSLRRARPSK